MADFLRALLIIVGILGLAAFVFVSEFDEKIKSQSTTLTPEQQAIVDQIGKDKDQKVMSEADKKYKENLAKAKSTKAKRNTKVALACPNCGAPLKAVYEACEYCGMSYREAHNAQK